MPALQGESVKHAKDSLYGVPKLQALAVPPVPVTLLEDAGSSAGCPAALTAKVTKENVSSVAKAERILEALIANVSKINTEQANNVLAGLIEVKAALKEVGNCQELKDIQYRTAVDLYALAHAKQVENVLTHAIAQSVRGITEALATSGLILLGCSADGHSAYVDARVLIKPPHPCATRTEQEMLEFIKGKIHGH